MNLRLAEEILYDLPPLEGVFLHWHTHGLTATTPGITSLLHQREQLLGAATLSGASITLLYACATDCLRRLQMPVYSPWDSRSLHARLLRHGPLCTGAGTRSLTRRQLRDIATALALPHRTVRQRTINSSAYHAVEAFAMQPGMVSPFLRPERAAGIAALILLPWPQRWEAQEREVAISLSLWESLALPMRCLRRLVRRYARRAYPQVRLIELGNESAIDCFEEARDGS